jgi:TPR repeat protein/formylglycine-generating enzyme required for sulfatase activity
MKKVLLVLLIILVSASSVFCGEFEDTLKKAEQGGADAQCNLGLMYYTGQSVTQNYKQAAYWFIKAAEQGHIWAQGLIGELYAEGNGVVQDFKQAVYWWTKAAEQGNVGAQNNLGIMYEAGRGAIQDYKQAAYWFTIAAKQGCPEAQYNLGRLCLDGRGTAQDYNQALYWYTKAAEQGYVDAQYSLGLMYAEGQGVIQDYKQAFYWWIKSAEQGSPEAQQSLGIMYYNGQGVTQNYKLAYVWWSLSATRGDKDSIKNRNIVAKKLTSQQLSEAQDLAAKKQYQIDNIAESQKPSAKSDTGEIIGTGTGFFITRDGYLLTCHHVVQDAARIEIYVGDKMYPASLVRSDSNNDLAILKINGTFQAMAFSPHRSAKMGQDVFTVGFPNPGLQGVSAKYTKGSVSSLTGFQDDLRLYQVSVPIQPGNSGGALLDENGNILGVVIAMLNAKKTFEISGSLPQNVNYAIKGLYAQAMIDTLSELNSKLIPPSQSKTHAIDNAQKSTAMIVCYATLDSRVSQPPEKHNKPDPEPPKAQLYVVIEPSGGKVRIINIMEKYYDGIELDPGRYKLEGSMDGYQTKTQWITIDRPTVVDVSLTLSPEPVDPAVDEPTKPSSVEKAPKIEKQSIPESSVAQQHDTSLPSNPTSGVIWKEPVTGMEFVWVPGGCFMMGSPLSEKTSQLHIEVKPLWYKALAVVSSIFPYGCVTSKTSYQSYFDKYGYHEDETPAHEVCLAGFWIGRYEVTQGQWKKILENNPSYFKAGEDYPVEKVSWNDVKLYVEKLNQQSGHTFLLPSEAQWEYAARSGGRQETYAGGNDVNRLAWYAENSGSKTHRVGSKAPNGLGLFDMSGNVWEWCEDLYDKDAYSRHAHNNPVLTSDSSTRVVRGGSWNYGKTDISTTFRLRFLSDFRSSTLGFRLTIENNQKTKNMPNRNAGPIADKDSSLKSSHDSGDNKMGKKRALKLDEAADVVLDILFLVPWWMF